MTETYDFPDSEDIPKIETTTEDPFTQSEPKKLFITYNSDEWLNEADIENVLRTINSLFGTDVQIAIMPDDFDFLTKDDLRSMIETMEEE